MLKVTRAHYAARRKYQKFPKQNFRSCRQAPAAGWARTIEKPDVAVRFFAVCGTIRDMHKQNRGVRFNCFSPPVMLATFVIEMALATYTMWRYRLDTMGRLAVAMLGFLAVFQISEYFVCGGAGMTAEGWAKVGYVSITLLPPLGLHMVHVLAVKPQRKLVGTGYATALGFIAYFLGYSGAFAGYQCTGNYVIFQLAVHSGLVYGAYYYGWLLTIMVLARKWMDEFKGKIHEKIQGPAKEHIKGHIVGRIKKQTQAIRKRHQAMWALSVGYLVFLVPTAVANTVKPETRRGIPSIMCGFAVLFAVILALYVMPRIGRRRTILS
jgi:hypothetical protein